MLKVRDQGRTLELLSPIRMPQASAFLWNPHMMVQINCRGYATAQYMQPEPAKYAHAPTLEATSFMQPEQPYYAHHPGRFFYIKDHDNGRLFSVPYEPVRSQPDDFAFICEPHRIGWRVKHCELEIELSLTLTTELVAELWQLQITNLSEQARNLSLTPYFPVGYMSWMNQSGAYSERLKAVLCRSITPYQKVEDYFKNKDLKDLTYLLADATPTSWEARQSQFEGDGGLHAPSALDGEALSNSKADYETPVACMQFPLHLEPGADKRFRFIFGPARDEVEIADVKSKLLDTECAFEQASNDYADYIGRSQGRLSVATPDPEFDRFVNHWLARQVYYHGDVNRLSTDPQTRNYLQDAMGMAYLDPERCRAAILHALSQQNQNGAMPDGILLRDDAELKYINQVPHMDHCVWLPICLRAYLDETGDQAILTEMVGYADSEENATVASHLSAALSWLFAQRDERGLNYIQQGDWCDPMNMVGYKGRGVSGWLTLATAYACNQWADICEQTDNQDDTKTFRAMAEACNRAVNQHLWSGDWYARGITDDNHLFGVASDSEGRIFLNPQSWAMLSGAADKHQISKMIDAVDRHLHTRYGVEMLSPAFTGMREDIGRVTQKHPGSAENGSIYNHAAAFYSYALFQHHDADRAFRVLRQMIPGPDQGDLEQRGQLPIFIPNYYRGASQQFPRTAGRSSQLFNTGTVHWFYRCLIDGLFGVQGCRDGLRLDPKLPSDWPAASLTRRFRSANLTINIVRDASVSATTVQLDGRAIKGNVVPSAALTSRHTLEVKVP